MKTAIQSGWSSSRNRDQLRQDQQQAQHQPPLSPTYISPRLAPAPPSFKTHQSPLKSLQAVFHKKQPQRELSAVSLNSVYTSSSQSSSFSETHSLHPFAAMLP